MAWLSGWTYRKKITIDNTNVDSDLSNFPLLVKISSDSDIGKARSDGYDIRFASSDGSTLLSYEREKWSGGGGSPATAIFWVKVPAISSSSTTDIYIYYGKADATDGEDAENVWDSNYDSVWHLSETSGTQYDSTSNNKDLTTVSVTTQGSATGKIDGADEFDGTSDYCKTTATYDFTNNFTISFWFKPDTTTQSNVYLISRFQTNDKQTAVIYEYVDDKVEFWSNEYTGADPRTSSQLTISDTNWHHVVYSYDGSTWSGYLDGTQVFSVSRSFSVNDVGPIAIGATTIPSAFFDGLMDEVRISKIGRSADWIKFEYHNINEADNELSWGSEESQAATYVYPSTLNITPTIQSPAVTIGSTLTPSTLTLTSNLSSPSILAGTIISPSTLSLSSSLLSPSITIGITLTPSTLTLTSTLLSPSIAAGVIASPSTLSLSTALSSPAINYDYQITATSLELTSNLIGPSFSISTIFGASSLEITPNLLSPSIAAGVIASPSTLSLTSNLLSPSISLSLVFDATTISLTSDLLDPIVVIPTKKIKF